MVQVKSKVSRESNTQSVVTEGQLKVRDGSGQVSLMGTKFSRSDVPEGQLQMRAGRMGVVESGKLSSQLRTGGQGQK